MDLAVSLSKRAHHPKTKVGAVLVSPDNREVWGVGYNGNARGESNDPDSLEPGQSGMVHAEVNCLVSSRGGRGGTLYLTYGCCLPCARAVINAGVSRVVIIHKYRCGAGISKLEELGVKVDEF